MQCYQCGKEISLDHKVGRQDTCPFCSSYLHCCRNCQFYDVNAHHQCREPQAEWVQDKEKSNFCDYFEPGASVKTVPSAADDARRKLDDLFKKKP
ncbi:hypothetical protein JXO59_06030 [candidate division KSB1 bacterium]|nr:hypothetical protein [candidate division KSB1 bacterium]